MLAARRERLSRGAWLLRSIRSNAVFLLVSFSLIAFLVTGRETRLRIRNARSLLRRDARELEVILQRHREQDALSGPHEDAPQPREAEDDASAPLPATRDGSTIANPNANSNGMPSKCGIVLNAAFRYKDVTRAIDMAERLLRATRSFAAQRPLVELCGGMRPGIALFVTKDTWEALKSAKEYPKATQLFDAVRFYEDYPDLYDTVVPEHRPKFYGSPRVWLLRMASLLDSPFEYTAFMDNDAFPCPGVERLFLPLANYDVVGVKDGFGGSRGDRLSPSPWGRRQARGV